VLELEEHLEGRARKLRHMRSKNNVNRSSDEAAARGRRKHVTYISWLRRKSAFLNGSNRPRDTAADAVKTHQLLRTSEDLERLFMGDIRIVAADNRLENLKLGRFLAKIASKSDLPVFLPRYP
jgi:hypothetical protein